MDERSIKDNIRMFRLRKGLSQGEVADALQISRAAYSGLEKGPVRVVNENVYALSSLLDVSPEELLLGYLPDQEASTRLHEVTVQYDAAYKKMCGEYDSRLDDKSAELAVLHELVRTQRETIRTQESIIAMLKGRIPEENA